jgi:uncharacterized membrane protein YkvA (DUF1232 family)
MPDPLRSFLAGLAAGLVLYAAAVAALALSSRRAHARALARFAPDCVVLLHRVLGDPRVPRARKVALGLALAYLAVPFDLVPDFVPIAGQLDDLLVVALAVRLVVRGAGRVLVLEHWPGPRTSLELVLRLAGAQ